MKAFKVLYNILQSFISIFFLYLVFCVSVLLASIFQALFGDLEIFLLLQATALAFAIIGFILLVNSIILIFAKKVITVKVVSVINNFLLLLFAILINFQFDIIVGVIVSVMMIANFIVAIKYNG